MNENPQPVFLRDAKTPVMDTEKAETMKFVPVRRTKPWAVGFSIVALCYLIWTMLPTSGWLAHDAATRITHGEKSLSEYPTTTRKLVPLEAHVMSKCPDTRDCLKLMVLPTMQRVYAKVNFTLSYIGTPTDNDGVSCMHGPEECMGNIIELCAAELYPDPKIYLGFTMCLSRNYHEIPQQTLVEDCALEHGIDFAKLNECAISDGGGNAMEMLRNSVRRTTDAGVTKSCTVRLNNEIYCIRDGGKWSDCPNGDGVNDLVIAIEKLYQSS